MEPQCSNLAHMLVKQIWCSPDAAGIGPRKTDPSLAMTGLVQSIKAKLTENGLAVEMELTVRSPRYL